MYKWAEMKVGILGAGIENIALTRYLLKQGAKVIVYDEHEVDRVKEKFRDIAEENLDIKGGADYLDDLTGDIFFRSPGMPLEFAKRIIPEGARLSSAMQLFFELTPAKIIGVTGTKGKGTTCALISEILKHKSEIRNPNDKMNGRVYLMGNIGKAPFDIFAELKPEDWVVMELSSFQLEDMEKSPHIAVVLGVTADHLAPLSMENPNYHKSFDDYSRAKRQIVSHQSEGDFAVLVKDNKLAASFAEFTKAHVDFCQIDRVDEGCFVEEGKIMISHGGKQEAVLEIDKISLPGEHNVINAMAAAMAGYLAGADTGSIAKGIQNFKGLPHRLQLVGEVDGVKYYDDSYATGPDAAMAAIRSFTEPQIVILGGSSKAADFSGLAKTIAKSSVKGVILIGDEAENIKEEIKAARANIGIAMGLTKMRSIVEEARDMAEEGDIVLLSPACASFGLFKNASDRGDQFQMMVKKLETRRVDGAREV